MLKPSDDNRILRPTSPLGPSPKQEEDTPKRPDVERPDRSDLLKRMKRVDPDQARRYRQRSGE